MSTESIRLYVAEILANKIRTAKEGLTTVQEAFLQAVYR